MGASDQYLEMNDQGGKSKFKKFQSRLNDETEGGEEESFQKKHKPDDFGDDDDTPF